jgi:hypothetical protein
MKLKQDHSPHTITFKNLERLVGDKRLGVESLKRWRDIGPVIFKVLPVTNVSAQ